MSKKLLLKNIDVEGIKTFEVFRKHGGYTAAEKALTMTPDEILEEVKTSGLRGHSYFFFLFRSECFLYLYTRRIFLDTRYIRKGDTRSESKWFFGEKY